MVYIQKLCPHCSLPVAQLSFPSVFCNEKPKIGGSLPKLVFSLPTTNAQVGINTKQDDPNCVAAVSCPNCHLFYLLTPLPIVHAPIQRTQLVCQVLQLQLVFSVLLQHVLPPTRRDELIQHTTSTADAVGLHG